MSGAGDIADLFTPLDRAGPGDPASLRWALGVAGTAPGAHVLDAGCGTGADLHALIAVLPDARITAIDTEPRFIERVRARFPAVRALVADMANPQGGPYDLIWSAGSVYQIGIEAALDAWAGNLAPDGRVAFSDLCWRVDDPPAEALAFWAGEGLTLGGPDALEARVCKAGWRVLGARWLGQGGWAAYYEPLVARLDSFQGDAALIAGFRAEIALWRAHGKSYDYRLIVAEPR